MLKATHPDQQQITDIVKVDPMLKRLRFSRLLMLIGGGLWLLSLAAEVLVSLIEKSSLFPTSFLSFYTIFFFVYVVFMLFYFTHFFKFWQRLERRRQLAAAGDQGLLASEQPRPDANALPVPTVLGQTAPVPKDSSLPTTFVQRPNWKIFLIMFGVVLLTIIICAVVFFLFFPALFPPLPHHHTLPTAFVFIAVAVFVVLMLLYCAILFAVMYFKARQHLTVTENGLLMLGFRKVHQTPLLRQV